MYITQSGKPWAVYVGGYNTEAAPLLQDTIYSTYINGIRLSLEAANPLSPGNVII